MVQRHICLTFPHWQWHCAFLNVSSNHLQEETQSHIGCICMTYLHCVFHMFPHCTRIRAGIVPLVAFVWLFFTVHLKMCPRIACPRRGIVTMVAFVWLFSSVCFQMCPQIVCPTFQDKLIQFTQKFKNRLPTIMKIFGRKWQNFANILFSHTFDSLLCIVCIYSVNISFWFYTNVSSVYSHENKCFINANCLPGRMQSHIGYISVKGIVTLVALCVFKCLLKWPA